MVVVVSRRSVTLFLHGDKAIAVRDPFLGTRAIAFGSHAVIEAS